MTVSSTPATQAKKVTEAHTVTMAMPLSAMAVGRNEIEEEGRFSGVVFGAFGGAAFGRRRKPTAREENSCAAYRHQPTA